MKQSKEQKQIIEEFRVRRNRQLLVMALSLLFLIFFVLLFKRPDLFGEISKNVIFGAQLFVILMFIVFSIFNWRCPSCNKYLGHDVYRRRCAKCGTKLQ